MVNLILVELCTQLMHHMKTERNEKIYRGPYIDDSCQVWLHLAKQFQKRSFFNINQSEKRIALGGHVCWLNGTK
jgi:hypothetical protein